MRSPLILVRVSGPSMVPTLRSGDLVVARRPAGRIRPGDVVIARFLGLPDRLVVKRAIRPVDVGWWLASDNAYAGADSEAHGAATVRARVLVRIRFGWPALTRVRRHGCRA